MKHRVRCGRTNSWWCTHICHADNEGLSEQAPEGIIDRHSVPFVELCGAYDARGCDYGLGCSVCSSNCVHAPLNGHRIVTCMQASFEQAQALSCSPFDTGCSIFTLTSYGASMIPEGAMMGFARTCSRHYVHAAVRRHRIVPCMRILRLHGEADRQASEGIL